MKNPFRRLASVVRQTNELIIGKRSFDSCNLDSERRNLSLCFETLETRQLMAADLNSALAIAGIQNPSNNFDVDYSGHVTPLDAFLISKHLSKGTQINRAFDVSGDGVVSSEDFFMEVAFINKERAPELKINGRDPDPLPIETKAASPANYQYSVTGNAADKVVNLTSGGLGLMGGGADVNALFQWMGQKALGGDFLVLTVTGSNSYNKYIKQLVPTLDSVATLVVPSLAGANNATVVDLIRKSEAIFITGGDQADYVNFWKDSAMEDAIYDAIARHATIGGTSAGLAVLGDFDFSAVNGTVTSAEALSMPNNSKITLDGGFINERDFTQSSNHLGQTSYLGILNNVVTDSHFRQRDRMGRLTTFMARLDADEKVVAPALPRGIGINEQTALLVEENGTASVVGNPRAKNLPASAQQRSVYFMQAAASIYGPLASPLTYGQLGVARIDYNSSTGSETFDLNGDWYSNREYLISATNGVLSSAPYGTDIA